MIAHLRNQYHRGHMRACTNATQPCPRCADEDVVSVIELDHPVINGDEEDTTRLQGKCDACGYEVDIDRLEDTE